MKQKRKIRGKTGNNKSDYMAKAITQTDFHFPNQKSVYRGKVRDVYNIDDKYLLMVVSDRISAFDVVLPEGIPYKGQVLNQIAEMFLDIVKDIVPTWNIATPDPNVTVGYRCEPYPVEMIVRGYLTGSSWRTYKSGAGEICGIPLPEGMREHQRFDTPLITPTTKAEQGMHDQDISAAEIISSGLIAEEEYRKLEDYSMKLFMKGSEVAAAHGLILVDTKYEFGKRDGEIILIDEIHTPDSSRYFYADGYEERFAKGEQQRQLSKEFVREWLMANGFQGRSGEKVPLMTPAFVTEISERYIELYESITGRKFLKAEAENPTRRIEENVSAFLSGLK
jgi:phosphoribosylaminoimidazole-succinocarboxamide synthase